MEINTNVKMNQNSELPVKKEKQRNVKLVIGTVVHGVCTCLYWSVIAYGVVMTLTIKEELTKLQELKDLKYYTPLYVTNWNFMFQTVFLSLSLIYDVLQWLDKHETSLAKKIRYLRDVIFSGTVIPYTLFISSMFWTLFLIDRELVFPEVYDVIVPWWFNHCIHTNIVIMVLLETLIQARRHPADLKVELILNGTVGVVYAIVYYSIYFFANRWLYAVFGILTWWQICLFQVMIWGSCFIFYFIQFPINRLFHKKEEVLNAPVATTEDKEYIDSVTGFNKHGPKQIGYQKNGNSDLQDPPFSSNPQNLKYRSLKTEFENSSL